MKKQMRGVLLSVGCAAGLLAAGSSGAQQWPAKPIRVVVTVPAGGAADVVMRLVGPKMSGALGQPVVVENSPGMYGSIAADRVARAAPDGYNLLFTTPSSQIVIYFLRKEVPYKPADFTPITAAVETVTTLVANPSVPARNLREFIDYAKKNPGKITYGSPGVGSTFHLVAEAFMDATGTELYHIPYKGVIAAVNDVVSGQINATFSAVSNIRPHVPSGKLKVLGVLEGQRYAGLPNVPAVGEIVPGFEKPQSWFALFGPARLPQPITQRLHGEMVKALHSRDIEPKLEAAGMNVIGNTPEEFGRLIKRGFEVYGAVAKKANLKAE
jgi:tripartite-type tricarboxylate transporter receptor subunit TctC